MQLNRHVKLTEFVLLVFKRRLVTLKKLFDEIVGNGKMSPTTLHDVISLFPYFDMIAEQPTPSFLPSGLCLCNFCFCYSHITYCNTL